MLAALCAVAASASSQSVELVGTVQGKPIGSGTFSITPGPNHTQIQRIVMTLAAGGHHAQLEETVKLAADGSTAESDWKEINDGTVAKNLKVVSDAKHAILTDMLTGTKKTYPVPSGSNVKNPSQLWFITIRPSAGSTYSATEFDTDKMGWQTTTRKYSGDVAVTVHGRKIMGHMVSDQDANQTTMIVLDDHGLPLSVEVQGIKFTRK